MKQEAHGNNEVVDLEEFSKTGKGVPPGKVYRFRVDKNYYETNKESLTGREILVIASKNPPEKHLLKQKIKGQVVDIKLDDIVSLLSPGLERFMTIPNEVTEGEPTVGRLDFKLLDDDHGFLEELGLPWEAVQEGAVRRVVIHGWKIPPGYNIQEASVNVRLDPGYPDTQIDMAYFFPPLTRQDGKPIRNLATDEFAGKSWQRWSRHRTPSSAWRIGVDNLRSHMGLVAYWLEVELKK